jgi:SAM-dependent methyltransferase
MDVFKGYAELYDVFYQEKNYTAECDFLEELFVRYANNQVRSILDLGCGTGGHIVPLAKRGYQVTGVDQSEIMLSTAIQKTVGLPVELYQGDIRQIDLQQTFDAVIAMFAVIGYMKTNDDLRAAFRTARRHMRPGDVFCFDTWFGPAVLVEHPIDRHKVIKQANKCIIRLVHPELNLLQQTVDVHYTVLHLYENAITSEVHETHTMRFLFPQETAILLEEAGFLVKHVCPFLRVEDVLDEREWNMTVIAEAK